MEDEDVKKYHGYLALSRQVKHLRRHLGRNLFHFYIDLVLEARWSRNDMKSFGKIMKTQSELAKELGINQSTLSKRLTDLMERDAKSISINIRSITVNYLPIFTTEIAFPLRLNDYSVWNEVYADMNKINAEVNDNYEKRNNKRTQKSPQSINTSSNVSTSLSPSGDSEYIDIDEVDEGIERMKKEKEQEYRS